MKLSNFQVLTFDCYGTLIDWEKGILTALTPLMAKIPGEVSAEAVLQDFARLESEQEVRTPGMIYSGILTEVYQGLARHYGVESHPDEARRFGASVPLWPAFPDSARALHYLQQHFKLVIISNVDHTSFAGSAEKLEVVFDYVYTAQDIGTYKPDLNNFGFLLRQLAKEGFGPSNILHTAQSIHHDHIPAKKLGLANAWIDRRKGSDGWGATAIPQEMPPIDFHFASMAEMAAAHADEII